MSWPTYGIGLERVKGIDIGGGGGPLGDVRLPQLRCVIQHLPVQQCEHCPEIIRFVDLDL